MKKILFFLLGLAFWAFPVSAETITVSPEGRSLTEALEQCADGDVIELAEGVYAEPGETFPLTVKKAVTIRAAKGASPVIDAPAFQAAVRVEAAGVTLTGLEIRMRRTGIYAVGDELTVTDCRIVLAEEAWRTSSCGMWCGGIYRMTVKECTFEGCGIALAGPPLSERSQEVPVLTGLFEVGEDEAYFTSHTIENCTVNGKPLFYAVLQETVEAPEDAGEVICCGCGEVTVRNADVSDCSMGMVLAYNDWVTVEKCKADRCGVFGIYAAKCGGGVLRECTSAGTNHGMDLRASKNFALIDCEASDCDQGLFFSHMEDSVMEGCVVRRTGQGYFLAGGAGNALWDCTAEDCENGFNLQKEGETLMAGCMVTGCTVCGVRLDWTPTVFSGNRIAGNWVGVMCYGEVAFEVSGNVFEENESCALYLRDIAYSRFCGNTFTGDNGSNVQAVGTMSGSLWAGNAGDMAAAEGAPWAAE
ncbi:MAG: right-handed parallel beta-helix repeat-containing protein [Eubacteriales bacterium]|nr:right-handed parallel beta-helix repeat-containing protein [Eubacteriales bacterium]